MRLLRRRYGKLAAALLLAAALGALWRSLPVRPQLAWQVPEECRVLGFTGDGRLLVTATDPDENAQPDIAVRLWDFKTRKQTAAAGKDVVGRYLVQGSLSPDGRLLVVHDTLDSTLSMVDTAINQKVSQFRCAAERGGDAPLRGVCFSPDSHSFAYTWRSYNEQLTAVCVWDIAKRTERYRLQGEYDPVFSPDAKTLATVFDGKSLAPEPLASFRLPAAVGVTLWDAASGVERQRFLFRGVSSVQSVVFSTDSRSVAIIAGASYPSAGLLVQLRDVASGSCLASRDGAWSLLESAPGTPLRRRMVVAVGPRCSKYLALDTGEERGTIGHEGYFASFDPNVEGVQILVDRIGPSRPAESSPDGRFLAKWKSERARIRDSWQQVTKWVPFLPAGQDEWPKTVELWDIGAGRKVATLPGDDDFAFSPDGELLAVRQDGHTIQIWNLPPRKPLSWFLTVASLLLLLTLGGFCWQARRARRSGRRRSLVDVSWPR